MLISYSKGARTWERHIDIEYEGNDWRDKKISPYCSTPKNIDQWFEAFHKAQEMCGGVSDQKRVITSKETKYLDELVRGYTKKKLS